MAWGGGGVSNPRQLGGIERYLLDDGQARGSRVAWIDTGGGLRCRVLIDRGMDIDQAFFREHSLTYLPHQGPTAPNRALDDGMDWLKAFNVGLLTTCGPFNAGGPATDEGERVGLHGAHSATPAELESVIQPDLQSSEPTMTLSGVVNYGHLYASKARLHRTIRSALGSNRLEIVDRITSLHNRPIPHAWLLHINLGYPLLQPGSKFWWNGTKVTSRDDPMSIEYFSQPASVYRTVPKPTPKHGGSDHVFAYVENKPIDRSGTCEAAVVNERLGIAFVVRYDARQFPRLGCWQHWGPGEYVAALEPMNSGVEGRDKDRARGWLDELAPGESREYAYSIGIETAADAIMRYAR